MREAELRGRGQGNERCRHIEAVLKRLGHGWLERTTGGSRQQLARRVARFTSARVCQGKFTGLYLAGKFETSPLSCFPEKRICLMDFIEVTG
jgi:hypothetical protein